MRFAVRLSILGMAFVVMFSIIGLRLWFVQVAQGPAIAQAAADQTWLSKTSYASRGDIYDRDGNLLVTSRLVPAVFVDRTFIQPEQRETLIQRLSALLAIDPVALDAAYEEAGTNGRFEVATVDNQVAFQIIEQLGSFPGVEIVKIPERVYLSGTTLAHVIGHLGLPDAADLADRDLDPSVRIGKLGVEAFYDELLQGTSGVQEYRVRRGEIIAQRPAVDPVPGNSLVLTTDSDLQQVVEFALEEGIALSNELKDEDRANGEEVFSETKRAAAVVLDPQTFEVLSLVSVPGFDPGAFVAGIDTETFEALNESFAFNNLAVSGLYPPASTFKAITYTAFLESNLPLPAEIEGVDLENRMIHCDGALELPQLADGSPQVRSDWYAPANKGWLDIHGALENSCNIFFWSVGLGTWQNRATVGENVIQDWAQSLGYGSETGIDLANEAPGIVPTRELFEEWAAYQIENPDEPPRLDPTRLNPELVSPWFGGDLMDFAIGQGAFTATPLQAAVSYAILVNGGMVREPRVVDRIVGPDGSLVEDIDPPQVRTVEISETTRSGLLQDLNRVVVSGTAAAAFQDFGPGLELVGGKTGTAQSAPTRDNHAWFIGVAPIDDPQYVVAVVIEEGGSGGAIAAPVARHILQYLMNNEPTPITEGQRAD